MGRKVGNVAIAASRRAQLGARFWQHRRLRLEPLEFRCLLSGSPVILSEIMAGNNDGDRSNRPRRIPTAGDPQYQQHPDGEPAGLGAPVRHRADDLDLPNMLLGPCESRVIFCDCTFATDPHAGVAHQLQSQQVGQQPGLAGQH